MFARATVPFITASTKFMHEAGFCTFMFILSNRTKANAPSQGPFFHSNVGKLLTHSPPLLQRGVEHNLDVRITASETWTVRVCQQARGTTVMNNDHNRPPACLY